MKKTVFFLKPHRRETQKYTPWVASPTSEHEKNRNRENKQVGHMLDIGTCDAGIKPAPDRSQHPGIREKTEIMKINRLATVWTQAQIMKKTE